ncbi:MAG TPA: hypothetical protein VD887_12650 [Allosphingosinicella sp.]|nr:hypothetical protein [Allosphingosinicella sp.]
MPSPHRRGEKDGDRPRQPVARPARGPRAAPERTHARASGKDGPQVVRTGDHRIGEEEIEAFLGHLAATCNATLAAKLTGFSKEAFYNRRERDPVLA